jgi:hypothetical protein
MNVVVYKKTTDDWYPSYEMTNKTKLVEVSFDSSEENQWVVTCSGDDDLLIQEFFDSENKAWQCFIEIIGQEVVTRDSVKTTFQELL